MAWEKAEPLFDVAERFDQSLRQARIARGEPPEGAARAEELSERALEYRSQLGDWMSEHTQEVKRGGFLAAAALTAAFAGVLAFALFRNRSRTEEIMDESVETGTESEAV